MFKVLLKNVKPIIIFLVYLLALFLKKKFKIVFSTIGEERIGNLAAACDLHIRKKIIKPIDLKVIFVIDKTYNKTLLSIFRRKLIFLESKLVKTLINISIEKLTQKNLFFSVRENNFAYKEYYQTEPQIHLSIKELDYGYSEIKKMGISRSNWWVCFHVRDGKYLKDLYKNRDLSYHSYRDFSEESMQKGIEEVTRRGGFVILMSDNSENLSFIDNPLVIKYNEKNFKTDFLDIFLTSNAKFFVGNTSGIVTVPKIFGVPVAVCNQIGFNFLLNQKNSIMIYKKLFCLNKQRLLTYHEMLKLSFFDQLDGWVIQSTKALEKMKLEPIENTNEEILGLVKDMFNIVDKKKLIKNELLLQEQFKQYFYSKQQDINFAGNISPSFIKLNKRLFKVLYQKKDKKCA